jgi:dihydrodipicolinate synthase/N-acetylneuraminate lyase
MISQLFFAGGTEAYHTYRIPALAVAANGDLLAFCEGRRDSERDSGQIDLLMRRSTDQGLSWGPQTLVASVAGVTCGNPCPVVDRETGILLLPFCQNMAEGDEGRIIQGQAPRTVWLTRSGDHGHSWSAPVEITAQTKKNVWTWYATGPGAGMQLAGGRILIPCDHVTGVRFDRGDPYGSHLIYSDDLGETWGIGAILSLPGNECCALECDNGDVYLNARTRKDPGVRSFGYSRDGGLSFLEEGLHRELTEPKMYAGGCQGSLLKLPGTAGRGSLFLFCNPAGKMRDRLTLHLSADQGRTWRKRLVLHEGPAAYSSMALLPGEISPVFTNAAASTRMRGLFSPACRWPNPMEHPHPRNHAMNAEKTIGLVAAPPTGFRGDGEVDLDVIEPMAEHLRREGVAGVFVNGTTGEGASLSVEERERTAERWRKVLPAGMKMFVHVGHNSLPDAQRLARHARGIGADAVAAIAPGFFKPMGIEGVTEWCQAIADGVPGLPFYFYHMPERSGLSLSCARFLEHAGPRIPNLAGVKFTFEALGDYQEALELEQGRYDLLFGRDQMLLCALACGAQGGVGSTYNIAAPLYLKLMDAFRRGDLPAARELQSRSIRLINALAATGNFFMGLKAMLKAQGVPIHPRVRAPLGGKPSDETQFIGIGQKTPYWNQRTISSRNSSVRISPLWNPPMSVVHQGMPLIAMLRPART